MFFVLSVPSTDIVQQDYDDRRPGSPPKVCAIDAIRGGGPAMTQPALLRDVNKARIAFDGARQLATGHWGCGAYGEACLLAHSSSSSSGSISSIVIVVVSRLCCIAT